MPGPSLANVAGSRQRSHSRVRVPRPHNRILPSGISESLNLEGQVPVCIYPRKRVAQLYPPDTGFPLRRLLQLAGLRCSCWNLPRRGVPVTARSQIPEVPSVWRFISNYIILALAKRYSFVLTACSYNPYEISSLTRGWICLL